MNIFDIVLNEVPKTIGKIAEEVENAVVKVGDDLEEAVNKCDWI